VAGGVGDTDGDERARLRAHLRLHLAAGIGAGLFARLVSAFGGVEAAAAAGPGAWRGVPGVGAARAKAIAAVTDRDIDEELAEAERCGARILCAADAAYPAALKTIPDPPAVLYVRGRLTEADAVAFAVVGSRRCTHYGLEQAERFGRALGRAGFTVVSGGARGIDTAAHRGALSGGGRTVAVMGCGLSSPYPRENARLFDRLVADDRGALLAELPMRTAVQAGNFPTRNRIISGLSLGVLIVEAARRSGSLITAAEAAEQGRAVFALPGRVDSPLSGGTHALIRDGVTLVRDLDDILDGLGEVGRTVADAEAAEAAALPPDLDDTERALVAALAGGPLALDELVRRTNLDTAQAAGAMTMLVLKGAVVQQPGMVFARRGAPRPAEE
jgi:DNA processing protein